MFLRGSGLIDKVENGALVFLIKDDSVLLTTQNNKESIPTLKEINQYHFSTSNMHYLGNLHGQSCVCSKFNDTVELPENFKLCDLRKLFKKVSEEVWFVAGYARQIVDWDRNFKYCGRCSSETLYLEKERARICKKCSLTNYPRISPAIIVAVIREGKILLGKPKKSKFPFFSVLAGFVEPRENLEECVGREVMEEVGIEVKNIRYFSSQSWPFPDSLMVGFFADYKSGEIKVDDKELLDAGWFAPDEVPKRPLSISISKKLIDEFIKSQNK